MRIRARRTSSDTWMRWRCALPTSRSSSASSPTCLSRASRRPSSGRTTSRQSRRASSASTSTMPPSSPSHAAVHRASPTALRRVVSAPRPSPSRRRRRGDALAPPSAPPGPRGRRLRRQPRLCHRAAAHRDDLRAISGEDWRMPLDTKDAAVRASKQRLGDIAAAAASRTCTAQPPTPLVHGAPWSPRPPPPSSGGGCNCRNSSTPNERRRRRTGRPRARCSPPPTPRSRTPRAARRPPRRRPA